MSSEGNGRRPGTVPPTLPSFAVAAMVREAPGDLARFGAHYARAGAARVDLYGDGPEDHLGAVAGVAGVAGLRFTPCDAAFWDGLGLPRPGGVEARQTAVYEHAFAGLGADWLLACDADELAFGEGEDALRRFLSAVPEEVVSVQIPSAEAVYGPGDPVGAAWAARWFRLPTDDEALLAEAYGEDARLLQRGLLGHHEGKQLLRRAARPAWIGLHVSGRPGGGVLTVPAAEALARESPVRLGHYDALSYERWAAKWAARLSGRTRAELMGERRRAQMAVIGEALAAGEGEALFRRLYGLDARQAGLLSEAGALVRRDLFAEG